MENVTTHFGLKHVIMCFHSTGSASASGKSSVAARGNIFLWLLFTWRVLSNACVCYLLLVGDMEILNLEEEFLEWCYWANISLGEFSTHDAQIKITETLFLAFER